MNLMQVEQLQTRDLRVVSIMKYFSYAHLAEPLQKVSKIFFQAAWDLITEVPDSAELVAGLRKLLEAKDCAVRAALDTRG